MYISYIHLPSYLAGVAVPTRISRFGKVVLVLDTDYKEQLGITRPPTERVYLVITDYQLEFAA